MIYQNTVIWIYCFHRLYYQIRQYIVYITVYQLDVYIIQLVILY